MVGPVIINSVVPPMTVKEPGNCVGDDAGFCGIVVGPPITRYGVPFIVVVEAPGIPFGASESGMDVAAGKIRTGVPFITVV